MRPSATASRHRPFCLTVPIAVRLPLRPRALLALVLPALAWLLERPKLTLFVPAACCCAR